jgi:hypothetical protein
MSTARERRRSSVNRKGSFLKVGKLVAATTGGAKGQDLGSPGGTKGGKWLGLVGDIKIHRNFRLFMISNVDRGEKLAKEGGGDAKGKGNGRGGEDEGRGRRRETTMRMGKFQFEADGMKNNLDDSEKEISPGCHLVWGERHPSEADYSEQSALLSKQIGYLGSRMCKGEELCRQDELPQVEGFDRDSELLWRYLADAVEMVERKCDVVSGSIRGVDQRQDCLPMLLYCVHEYMAPLLRRVEVDYEKMGELGDEDPEDGINYRNADKIQFVQWVEQGKISVGLEQRRRITDLRNSAMYLCECVYADQVVEGDGGGRAGGGLGAAKEAGKKRAVETLMKLFVDELI